MSDENSSDGALYMASGAKVTSASPQLLLVEDRRVEDIGQFLGRLDTLVPQRQQVGVAALLDRAVGRDQNGVDVDALE